jgi:hypothetical protein
MGEMRNAHKFLIGNPDGMKLLGRPIRGQEDNIKADVKEIRRERVSTGFICLQMGMGTSD